MASLINLSLEDIVRRVAVKISLYGNLVAGEQEIIE
jgi:hypothetical protein